MILKPVLIGVSALAMLLPVRDSGAAEALSTGELLSHCARYAEAPVGEDATFCVRYIQGFIDGALATDARVSLNVAAEYGQEESFGERAIRTRVGRRLERYGPSYYAEFCLGEIAALKEVVGNVINSLLRRKVVDEGIPARDIVYQTLRQEYPCEANRKE
ncbi:MAG: hypothetical protein E4H19_16240 [Chromatiales bacterium]|jgi:hypothetical protein|nr:MAG: hypothetical protein E4H19_16240 [Chromatiales bacterium]